MPIKSRHLMIALGLLLHEQNRHQYWGYESLTTSYTDGLALAVAMATRQREREAINHSLLRAIATEAKEKQSALIDSIPVEPPLTPDEKLDVFAKVKSYQSIVERCSELLNENHV